ncbi:hypothetical protein QJS04_geneDACA002344 [Acorus gramineus]|uniref:Uncharacterized protein n=1 Tax=Acorus gramineus TaxID=55184 RepID=A0AAV9AAB0_ACOGR|nr:hypothetical protein QJS04_geneDACA002344 [Acorus gramineus]
MQQRNYAAAEVVYRKAQTIEPDRNKDCNLSLCLIKQGRLDEARSMLEDVLSRTTGSDNLKMISRAEELLREVDSQQQSMRSSSSSSELDYDEVEESIIERLDMIMNEWTPFQPRRLPIFEEISDFRDQMAC